MWNFPISAMVSFRGMKHLTEGRGPWCRAGRDRNLARGTQENSGTQSASGMSFPYQVIVEDDVEMWISWEWRIQETVGMGIWCSTNFGWSSRLDDFLMRAAYTKFIKILWLIIGCLVLSLVLKISLNSFAEWFEQFSLHLGATQNYVSPRKN